MRRWMRWTAMLMILCLFALPAAAEMPDLSKDDVVYDQAQIFEPEDAQSVRSYGRLLWETYGVQVLAVTVVGLDGARIEDYLFELQEEMDTQRWEYALLVLAATDQACGVVLSERLSQEITPSKRDELVKDTMAKAYASGEVSAGLRDTYMALCDAVAEVCESRPEEKKAGWDRWDHWQATAEMIAEEAARMGKVVAESSVMLAEELAEAGKSWWENVKTLWNEP